MKRLIVVIAVLLTAAVAVAKVGTSESSASKGWKVTAVVDGDTIKVRKGLTRRTVRIIGIDTPELHKPGVKIECGAKTAKAIAVRNIYRDKAKDSDGDGLVDSGSDGQNVRLKYDSSQDRHDRYGRLLAYVEVGKADRDLGRYLVARGAADVYIYESKPFARAGRYQQAASAAKSHKRGVYRTCDGDFHSEQESGR